MGNIKPAKFNNQQPIIIEKQKQTVIPAIKRMDPNKPPQQQPVIKAIYKVEPAKPYTLNQLRNLIIQNIKEQKMIGKTTHIPDSEGKTHGSDSLFISDVNPEGIHIDGVSYDTSKYSAIGILNGEIFGLNKKSKSLDIINFSSSDSNYFMSHKCVKTIGTTTDNNQPITKEEYDKLLSLATYLYQQERAKYTPEHNNKGVCTRNYYRIFSNEWHNEVEKSQNQPSNDASQISM